MSVPRRKTENTPDFSIKNKTRRCFAAARPILLADQEDSIPDTKIRQWIPQSECGNSFNSEINGLIFAALTHDGGIKPRLRQRVSVYIVKQQEA